MNPRFWAVKPLFPVLSWLTVRYIAHHRGRLWPQGKPISPAFARRLAEFFPKDVLAETRLVRAVVPSPFFYPLVQKLGLGNFPEMTQIGAITFVDLIAYPGGLGIHTLFHELVHVVQYRVLGLNEFARRYVWGFAQGGGYDGIPLERQAYELEARFGQNPNRHFCVEEEVRRRWREKQL